jgi:hypothetical protein
LKRRRSDIHEGLWKDHRCHICASLEGKVSDAPDPVRNLEGLLVSTRYALDSTMGRCIG